MAKAAPICFESSTPSLYMIASSIWICAGLMKSESSPGSLKSVCAANSVMSRMRVSPQAERAEAAIVSSVPPMQ